MDIALFGTLRFNPRQVGLIFTLQEHVRCDKADAAENAN